MSTGRETRHTENRGGLTDLLACVSHGTRRQLLQSLAESPKAVSMLAGALDLEIDKISHHLRPLRECGLVQATAVKKQRIYSLSDRVTTSIRGEMLHLSVAGGNDVCVVIQTRIQRQKVQSDREPLSG